MDKLAKLNSSQMLDVLNERLTFERAGVRLYDRIIGAMTESPLPVFQQMVKTMTHNRNEEKEHEEWLEAQIRALGGSAHEQTELSELVQEESRGIEQVVLGHAEIPHMLHALLAAELVDNAGWDLLVAIADEAGDAQAKRAFKRRLHEEEKHLAYLREAMQEISYQRVLGEEAAAP